ncbi:MAG TPA: hypothetical protein VML96_10305 [Egibacteraceae bacterium]|nr:hypothetical protein [Egibacteraceae bacterium]
MDEDIGHKRCSRCDIPKPTADFLRRTGSHRRQSYCSDCKADYQREWYRLNRERHMVRVKRLREQQSTVNRQIIETAKDVPCADCGMRYPPYVMDFDHVTGRKTRNVSQMRSRASESQLRTEISKCEVVCANCHRVRTFSRSQQVESRGVGGSKELGEREKGSAA